MGIFEDTYSKKDMEKNYIHLFISVILVFPASLYLENSDGIDVVNDLPGAIREWFTGLSISLVIAIIYWLINKKKTLFIKVFYISCYAVSFLVFGFWIVRAAGVWGFLIFILIFFLVFSKRGKKYISKLNLFSKENNTSNNTSKSKDDYSKIDDIKTFSKPFIKEIDNTFNEAIKLAKEKSSPILKKAKKTIDELKKNSTKKSKDQAIDELKKLKELLDVELISQEEFDEKSKELKKIILDN